MGQLVGFLSYVAPSDVEDLPSLPPAILCSHCYVAFPRFEVAEEDEDEGALQYAARLSSGRDLVEEFIAYGVWPLEHGWVFGQSVPPSDANPGRPVGVKSCPYGGFTRSQPGHVSA
jgi:hypothetical protein